MFDWVHNGEGLTTFNLHGLMDPTERNFEKRVRRFSEMYMGADPAMGPGSQNYDPQHKVIRSLLNGSRGPMLRKVTPRPQHFPPSHLHRQLAQSEASSCADQSSCACAAVGDRPGLGGRPAALLAGGPRPAGGRPGRGKTHDHCWHLGCNLPRVPAMIVRANRSIFAGWRRTASRLSMG